METYRRVNDTLYYHVSAAAMLFIGLIVTVFVIAGIIGLFQAGVGVFFGVIGGVVIFAWLTHELAKYMSKRNLL